ncbi:MAG: hypothetical protein RR216_02410 [Pseudoflavonifractor sp.]
MLSKSHLLLTVSPTDSRAALTYGVPMAHIAYRVGGGPHLFRSAMPIAIRGGLMVIDDAGFDGLGDSAPFCQEVMRECLARGFDGVICDFETRPFSILGKIISELGELMAKRGWPLYVTEPYARFSEKTKVMISSALSGGSLRQRLGEAVTAYGAERVALSVERVAEDFFLPSPAGQGVSLSRTELAQRIEELSPSIFFSGELCAHYFTYMSPKTGAHFILFDDGGSIRKKLQIARGLDISDAILSYPQVSDLLPELLR